MYYYKGPAGFSVGCDNFSIQWSKAYSKPKYTRLPKTAVLTIGKLLIRVRLK